jgi:hypothetical protein
MPASSPKIVASLFMIAFVKKIGVPSVARKIDVAQPNVLLNQPGGFFFGGCGSFGGFGVTNRASAR